MTEVRVGNTMIGDGHPCFVIAEIGINHNGDIDIAKRLIDSARVAGCDCVKFQKRTPQLCVPHDQRGLLRETPWGTMTYLEYRERVEFGALEFGEIDQYCKSHSIPWLASSWDEQSLDFISNFDVPVHKIASACLTDDSLLRRTRATGKPILLSTGMSSMEQVDHAVDILGTEQLVLLHSMSAYPARYEELNLRVVDTLRCRYGVPVGYSGHETGLPSTVAAVVLGACVVERHITLDRAMWGSDHAASLEPNGINRLVRDIRLVESALGDGVKRIQPREIPMIQKLRRIGAA